MNDYIKKLADDFFKIPAVCENEIKMREASHLILTSMGIENIENEKLKSKILNNLKKLRIDCLKNLKSAEFFNCRIDLLLSRVIFAGDLLLSLEGRRVLLSEASPIVIKCSPDLLRDCILMIIDYLSNNKITDIKLKSDNTRIFIIIKSSKTSIDLSGNALFTARKIMLLQGGGLFTVHSDDNVKFILYLPNKKGDCMDYSAPDYAEYVGDGMSAVKVMLCSGKDE